MCGGTKQPSNSQATQCSLRRRFPKQLRTGFESNGCTKNVTRQDAHCQVGFGNEKEVRFDGRSSSISQWVAVNQQAVLGVV